ncbi:MAG TPA: 4-hydroxy-tetrahydrodipicolinate synthase [candidate division WOR-3 bacterium]|uniref:4-hydroxy-tetrahydrodipicolinate synthase n=1 Tax=candidate division WOR-3 bacterium TaxID=2052148 RepID=A0A7C0VB08_UNCW3|nr:4-hydroxy-tetrahydrodipicolinate synthase [candidate division WOR-3 bacterium]
MLKGSIVALSTPFKDDGVNIDTLKKLIEFHNKNKTDGILVLGTTGESPTISDKEREEIIATALSLSKSPVIVGTGTNSTEKTIKMTKKAWELGAEYALVITPYYNKPNQEGLYQHFRRVAEAVDIKIIIYNVPSRTGISILPETVAKLAEIKNIVGIKEASGNLKNMTEIIQFTPDDFVLLSGDDFLTLPIMSIGGKGVISVTANVVPERVHMFTRLCLEGKFTEAQKMNYEIYELSMAMFIDTNPIPVKEALNLMGFDMGEPRLPLVKLGEEKREKLKGILKKYGVI